jgi:hypothetical protein
VLLRLIPLDRIPRPIQRVLVTSRLYVPERTGTSISYDAADTDPGGLAR